MGANLSDAVFVVLMLPVLGVPYGVIGAALGARLRTGRPGPASA